MRRALRWIGWGFAGVTGLVVLLVIVISVADNFPKKMRTVWIDGPGDTRIRGETWVTTSLWDSSEVYEYTQVAPDGTETPIGEGPRQLDIAKARVYELDDQAELVVLGTIFRRDHSGRWSAFRADDANFVYRHYASGITQELGNSWYYEASGISCWIAGLDQARHRLVSACNFPETVRLIFRRASYDDLWVLDEAATFAETPPPQRIPFPEAARGTLTTVRIEPTGAVSALLERSRQLEPALAGAGSRMVAQIEFELVGSEATDVAVETEGYKKRWRARGGWVDSRGWPVLFWSVHPVGHRESFAKRRGQPWQEALLVQRSRSYGEDASYLTYLELRPR
jgi:hypothetical protein